MRGSLSHERRPARTRPRIHTQAPMVFEPAGIIVANAVHLWGRQPANVLVERARARATHAQLFIGVVVPFADDVVRGLDDALAGVVGIDVVRTLRRRG